MIKDVFFSITFLSFFIIQKSFNRFSASLHIKLNELIVAHEHASNHLVRAEEKTEEELKELSKKHEELIKEDQTVNRLVS